MEEVEKQDGAFRWLHHSIVECGGKPIGFCRYYTCADSDELWEGFPAMGGSYSIDYLIGETGYLRRGIGRQIVTALTERIRAHGDAERIVAAPDQKNRASCGLLLASVFTFDTDRSIYVKAL